MNVSARLWSHSSKPAVSAEHRLAGNLSAELSDLLNTDRSRSPYRERERNGRFSLPTRKPQPCQPLTSESCVTKSPWSTYSTCSASSVCTVAGSNGTDTVRCTNPNRNTEEPSRSTSTRTATTATGATVAATSSHSGPKPQRLPFVPRQSNSVVNFTATYGGSKAITCHNRNGDRRGHKHFPCWPQFPSIIVHRPSSIIVITHA